MFKHRRLLAVAALCVIPAATYGQTANPSGHWTGSVNVPNQPVPVEIDLGKDAKGDLIGALTNPVENVRLPLAKIAVDGTNVRFFLNAGQQSGTFIGAISADGKAISGHYDTVEGGYTIPFELTRTGEAKFEAAPKNAPIGKELEGTWNGTLTVEGAAKRLKLTLSNQSDSTSRGTLVNLDGASIEIPLGIIQKGTTVTLDAKMSGGAFTGTLSADGTQLVGTWTQGALSLPLTFRRTDH